MKQIVITFTDFGCTWASVGWGHQKNAMAKAKKAINKGNTPAEVIELLEKAGFEVIEEHA